MKSQPRFHRVPYQSQKTIQTDFGFQQLSKNPCLKKRLRKGFVLDVLQRMNLSMESDKKEGKRENVHKEKKIRKKSVKKKSSRSRNRWKI